MRKITYHPIKAIDMIPGIGSDTERKVISILKVLSESSEPLGSITIARELERYGVFMSERAIRYHLRITDERGYTKPMGRDGRMITPEGVEELRMAMAPEQIGFILERLELLAFRTTFDPKKGTGLVAINASMFDESVFKKALGPMREAFKAGICVSDRVMFAAEGQKLGDLVVPKGKVGLGTVCGVSINGVLLKAGVPIESRFGGVLEIRDSQPRRFVAIINYDGTSIDPSEQYIRAGMTRVLEAARTGNGKILANFREIPAAARSLVEETIAALADAGISGVSTLGNISEPICQITVGMNRVGLVLLGGLNPLAAAAEAGIEVENTGEAGMVNFEQLQSFWDL
jgi:repressor of nif and glnA expression